MSYTTQKLKDISVIRTGKLDSNAAVENGIYPFFTCDPQTLRINTWAYDTEAVLLAGNNASGNYTAKYYRGKFNAYQRTYIIETADSEVLSVRFLCYAINQQLRLLKTMSSGSTTKFLTIRMLHNLDIPCPDIEVQNRIVNVLGNIDDLIENNQKQIKLLEESTQRLYKEWFVDLRFPGYENTPIVDGMPEGWERKTADSFFNITIGKTPPRAEKQWFIKGMSGIPWVSISDMGNAGVYVFNTTESLTDEAVKKHGVKIIPEGTILVSFKLTVGRVSITTKQMCTNEAIAHFPVDNQRRCYSYLYLKHFKYDNLGNTSSISKAVNSKIVKAMPFVMPDSKTIESFESLVSPFLKQIYDKQHQIQRLTEARDRLLPKLMNGEMEV